ncbi:MAG TPA: SRPBCC family protein [Actinomycetes bacterium]|nr:SRPBCC family protein [Actinomycetes bacterium]
MDINRNAPATAEGERQIAADPQTVFAVISAIDQWPSWNPDVKSVELQGPVQEGTVFRWKSGPSTLTSTLQVVDPPHEIAWTGTTMGIKAVHVFRFQANDVGTLARSEESWEGLIASLLKGYSRKTLDKGIRSVLAHLKTEAERRAAAA